MRQNASDTIWVMLHHFFGLLCRPQAHSSAAAAVVYQNGYDRVCIWAASQPILSSRKAQCCCCSSVSESFRHNCYSRRYEKWIERQHEELLGSAPVRRNGSDTVSIWVAAHHIYLSQHCNMISWFQFQFQDTAYIYFVCILVKTIPRHQ